MVSIRSIYDFYKLKYFSSGPVTMASDEEINRRLETLDLVDVEEKVIKSLLPEHKPHMFTSKEDHDNYELEYRVYPGEMIRFDNLAPCEKRPILDDLELVSLTLGKMYKVEDCPRGNSFGRKTWLTIRNDKNELVRHYRGRFTKVSVSGVPEPTDEDII